VSSNPLDAYKEFDPKLIEQYEKLQGLTYSEGALSVKFKLLIALAIDEEQGALQEIFEALRIAYQIGGNRALFTSAQVLQALFKQK
jgi:alkylhydroperoxidase/carboxymuconolactone decarboxylase family protein YurZ